METKELGEKIKLLRKQKHITIESLAKMVNMSKSTVGMWESGQRRPEYEELLKLANIFGKSVAYFLEADNENIVTIMGRNGTHRKFVLSDEQLNALESLAEAMAKKDE